MELWDAYDGDFQKIKDTVLIRGEPIPEGLYHLVCSVLVRHEDGSYLLMQRDIRKHWGRYVGGHGWRGCHARRNVYGVCHPRAV